MSKPHAIPVTPDTYERLFRLPCVTSATPCDGDIVVTLAPDTLAPGSPPVAHTGDAIRHLRTGKWSVVRGHASRQPPIYSAHP